MQNGICSGIDYPPGFGAVRAFTLSRRIFEASNVRFLPNDTYLQQTLDYAAVEPLYEGLNKYAAEELNITLANRGDAHITVGGHYYSQCTMEDPMHQIGILGLGVGTGNASLQGSHVQHVYIMIRPRYTLYVYMT